MPEYVALIDWTDQGVRDFKDTVDRYEAAEGQFQSLGVRFTNVWWTLSVRTTGRLRIPSARRRDAGGCAAGGGGAGHSADDNSARIQQRAGARHHQQDGLIVATAALAAAGVGVGGERGAGPPGV